MSNFQDISWVPRHHRQLQEALSTLDYRVTRDNTTVDSILCVCERELQDWKLRSSAFGDNEWKGIPGTPEAGNSVAQRFRSESFKYFFRTLLFGFVKMRIGLTDTSIPSPPSVLAQTSDVLERTLVKRDIDYWVMHLREGFHELVSSETTPELFHFREYATLPSRHLPASTQLLEQAAAFTSVVKQGSLVANILYVAWALRGLMEGGGSFIEEHMLPLIQKKGTFYLGPFILTTLISPLVLLHTTSMLKPNGFPSQSDLISYVLEARFLSTISPAEKLLENALLRVILKTCERGSFDYSDFSGLVGAWSQIKTPLASPVCVVGRGHREASTRGEVEGASSDNPQIHSPHAADGEMEGGSGGSHSSSVTRKRKVSPVGRQPRRKSMRVGLMSNAPYRPPRKRVARADHPKEAEEDGEDGELEENRGEPQEKRKEVEGGEVTSVSREFTLSFQVPNLDQLDLDLELVLRLSDLDHDDPLKNFDDDDDEPHQTPRPTITRKASFPNLSCLTITQHCRQIQTEFEFPHVNPRLQWETSQFIFPHFPTSHSFSSFRKMYMSEAHNRCWRPYAISELEVKEMAPGALQRLVNEKLVVVVTGAPSYSRSDYERMSEYMVGLVRCADTDQLGEDAPEYSYEDGATLAREILDWKTSRPVVISELRGGPSLPIETRLNTPDEALARCNQQADLSTWRAPIIAASGAYSPPHQDSNGMGAILYCASGYKAFLLSLDVQTPIGIFENIPGLPDISLGWEYLYYPPYRFGSFVLCPGQTLLMAPGQVHGVATLSRKEAGGELTAGSLMHGSQFLSAHTMVRSLLWGWVDRATQEDTETEGQSSRTILTCLMAMVSCALQRLMKGRRQLHDSSPGNIIALGFMALLFLGNGNTSNHQLVLALLSISRKQYQETYESVERQFHDVQAANCRVNPSSDHNLNVLHADLRLAVHNLSKDL